MGDRKTTRALFPLAVAATLFCFLESRHGHGGRLADQGRQQSDWPAYGGAPEGNHYSSLAEINRGNVTQLKVAWSYDTGEAGGLQTSPIIVGGVLYGLTPSQKAFALDAATGKELWKFDSGVRGTQP